MCEVPPSACFEPFNYWFHLTILNCYIRRDRKQSFPICCPHAIFLSPCCLLCLSILVTASPPGRSQSVQLFLIWKLFHTFDDFCCFPLDFFFGSTLFFLKQKDQIVQLSRFRQAVNLCGSIKQQNRCSALFCNIPTISSQVIFVVSITNSPNCFSPMTLSAVHNYLNPVAFDRLRQVPIHLLLPRQLLEAPVIPNL